MNVIICGAGEVGTYAAEVLGNEGHDVTVIDARPSRLRSIEDRMDVRTLAGNAATADMLREAGVRDGDTAVIAATSSDEINLLIASVARGLGAERTIARVHHSAYFHDRGDEYRKLLGIDRLICPEYSTALSVGSTLRNPSSSFVQNFAAEKIEMQEFPVDEGAKAVGRTLVELAMPRGLRLAAVRRDTTVSLPVATTRIEAGDVLILVGNTADFQEGRKLFQRRDGGRRNLVLMGGSSTAAWLARGLRDRQFSIRLFVSERRRAEELAAELDWVTVLHADPTDTDTFEDERIADADAFVGVDEDDEHNILGCAWAKASGVKQTVAVVQRPQYVHLIQRVGIDQAFSPRRVAVRQIARTLNRSKLLQMASLAEGVIDCYRVRVGVSSQAVGIPLRKLNLSPNWMVVALEHDGQVAVPGADDFIHADDTVTVVGRHGTEKRLREMFDT